MRKYNLFVRILLVILCVFPLLYSLIAIFYNGAEDAASFFAIVKSMDINPSLSGWIQDTYTTIFDTALNDALICLIVILSNTMMIYISYVFIKVLLFVPEMAIKLLRIGVRKDD